MGITSSHSGSPSYLPIFFPCNTPMSFRLFFSPSSALSNSPDSMSLSRRSPNRTLSLFKLSSSRSLFLCCAYSSKLYVPKSLPLLSFPSSFGFGNGIGRFCFSTAAQNSFWCGAGHVFHAPVSRKREFAYAPLSAGLREDTPFASARVRRGREEV